MRDEKYIRSLSSLYCSPSTLMVEKGITSKSKNVSIEDVMELIRESWVKGGKFMIGYTHNNVSAHLSDLSSDLRNIAFVDSTDIKEIRQKIDVLTTAIYKFQDETLWARDETKFDFK